MKISNGALASPQPDTGAKIMTAKPLVSIDSAILQDVKVSLEARLGSATLSMADFLALEAGSVVALDVRMNEPIELRLNQSLVARGIIVAVGDHFGVRIVEIAGLS